MRPPFLLVVTSIWQEKKIEILKRQWPALLHSLIRARTLNFQNFLWLFKNLCCHLLSVSEQGVDSLLLCFYFCLLLGRLHNSIYVITYNYIYNCICRRPISAFFLAAYLITYMLITYMLLYVIICIIVNIGGLFLPSSWPIYIYIIIHVIIYNKVLFTVSRWHYVIMSYLQFRNDTMCYHV